MQAISARAPGKLVILGEYAVLSPGEPAIVMAVNRYLTVRLWPCDRRRIRIVDQRRREVRWSLTTESARVDTRDPALRLLESALQVGLGYQRARGFRPKPFRLEIRSELQGAKAKYGLGSSAALVTAVIGAVVAAAGAAPTSSTLFKLAHLAHYRAETGGSGVDIAAAVYGGWIRYTSAGPELLTALLGRPAHEAATADWPALTAVAVIPDRRLGIVAGFSGHAVRTAPRLVQVRQWEEAEPSAHQRFLLRSRANVRNLLEGWKEGRHPAASVRNLAVGRHLLLQLGRATGLPMETKELSDMHLRARQYHGAAKPSGSGGGDSGVAFLSDRDNVEPLMAAWEADGIVGWEMAVSGHGVEYASLRW